MDDNSKKPKRTRIGSPKKVNNHDTDKIRENKSKKPIRKRVGSISSSEIKHLIDWANRGIHENKISNDNNLSSKIDWTDRDIHGHRIVKWPELVFEKRLRKFREMIRAISKLPPIEDYEELYNHIYQSDENKLEYFLSVFLSNDEDIEVKLKILNHLVLNRDSLYVKDYIPKDQEIKRIYENFYNEVEDLTIIQYLSDIIAEDILRTIDLIPLGYGLSPLGNRIYPIIIFENKEQENRAKRTQSLIRGKVNAIARRLNWMWEADEGWFLPFIKALNMSLDGDDNEIKSFCIQELTMYLQYKGGEYLDVLGKYWKIYISIAAKILQLVCIISVETDLIIFKEFNFLLPYIKDEAIEFVGIYTVAVPDNRIKIAGIELFHQLTLYYMKYPTDEVTAKRSLRPLDKLSAFEMYSDPLLRIQLAHDFLENFYTEAVKQQNNEIVIFVSETIKELHKITMEQILPHKTKETLEKERDNFDRKLLEKQLEFELEVTASINRLNFLIENE